MAHPHIWATSSQALGANVTEVKPGDIVGAVAARLATFMMVRYVCLGTIRSGQSGYNLFWNEWPDCRETETQDIAE